MKIKVSKRFIKDTQKITEQRILTKIRQLLEQTQQIKSLDELANLTELTGYANFYRIKFDYRYRIGIYYENDCVEFLRVGTREDFYKKFP